MLSPGIRQVTHALLTRPPLTCDSQAGASTSRFHHKSVRLACVKHAASVHPEPGSNSHHKSLSCQFTSGITVCFGCLVSQAVLWIILLMRICLQILYGIFSGLHYCLFVKEQILLLQELIEHTTSFPACQHFFCCLRTSSATKLSIPFTTPVVNI